MTKLEIIELADSREPNHYDTQQKLRWLEMLQERVEKETGYILRKEGTIPPPTSWAPPFTHTRPQAGVQSATGRSPALSAEEGSQGEKPFETEICIQYLIAQISAANGETERYNRSITLFNEMYAAFLSALIRQSHGLKANFSI